MKIGNVWRILTFLLLFAVVILGAKYKRLLAENKQISANTHQCLEGKNYGDVFCATVRIVKAPHFKMSSDHLQIIRIDGNDVEAKKLFMTYVNESEMDLAIDGVYTCKAYFSGGYVGTPDSLVAEIGYATSLFHFQNRLYITGIEISKYE
jgi:hypothetical protein